MSESAILRGQTGFLHPIRSYVVIYGSRTVHAGRIKREAIHSFRRHVRCSREAYGKAVPQTVRLTIDGKLSQTYEPNV